MKWGMYIMSHKCVKKVWASSEVAAVPCPGAICVASCALLLGLCGVLRSFMACGSFGGFSSSSCPEGSSAASLPGYQPKAHLQKGQA
eukprot:4249798-Amphidinium_carterae.1